MSERASDRMAAQSERITELEAQLEEHYQNERQSSGHRYCCALEWWGRECPDKGPPESCTCDSSVALLKEAT